MNKRAALLFSVLLFLSAVPLLAEPSAGGPDLVSRGFTAVSGEVPASIGGLDLRGISRSLDLRGDRLIVLYSFRPGQADARKNLAALEELRSRYAGRLIVAAFAPDAPSLLAASLRGLELRFPVLSNPKTTESLGLPGSPAFLILAPGGRAVAQRKGAFDWTSASAKAFVEELFASNSARPAATGEPASVSPASSKADLPDRSYLSPVESGVVAEINLARTDPKVYAKFLREYRALIHNGVYEQPGEIGVQLEEGTRAVDEAIGYLERQAALGPLTASKGLSSAAKTQAVDQGRSGATGHSGSDGSSPFDRMNRYGKWQVIAGENIAYGSGDARGIVIQLIVDDGVASRGHRDNIFKPSFKVVGIGVGPHPKYGTVCVQDFAGDYEEKN
jgi:uncharacterized protein YkwD